MRELIKRIRQLKGRDRGDFIVVVIAVILTSVSTVPAILSEGGFTNYSIGVIALLACYFVVIYEVSELLSSKSEDE